MAHGRTRGKRLRIRQERERVTRRTDFWSVSTWANYWQSKYAESVRTGRVS